MIPKSDLKNLKPLPDQIKRTAQVKSKRKIHCKTTKPIKKKRP